MKQHNVAVCIADDDISKTRDENSAWKQKQTGGGGGGGGGSNGAREACMAAVKEYDMPPDVVSVVSRCERFFDIDVNYHDTLDEWSNRSGTMALAGDSCHAMPPFLGQGANQSLQDSWCIAECLSRVRGVGVGVGAGGSYGAVVQAE